MYVVHRWGTCWYFRHVIYLKYLIINSSEGSECVCLCTPGQLHTFAYIFEHSNSQILLVSFPSCSGCDWRSQMHLFLLANEHLLFCHCSTAEEMFLQRWGTFMWPTATQLAPNAVVMLIVPWMRNLVVFPLKLLTDRTLLNRPLSVAVCLCLPHTLTGHGADPTYPLRYLPVGIWSASL